MTGLRDVSRVGRTFTCVRPSSRVKYFDPNFFQIFYISHPNRIQIKDRNTLGFGSKDPPEPSSGATQCVACLRAARDTRRPVAPHRPPPSAALAFANVSTRRHRPMSRPRYPFCAPSPWQDAAVAALLIERLTDALPPNRVAQLDGWIRACARCAAPPPPPLSCALPLPCFRCPTAEASKGTVPLCGGKARAHRLLYASDGRGIFFCFRARVDPTLLAASWLLVGCGVWACICICFILGVLVNLYKDRPQGQHAKGREPT